MAEDMQSDQQGMDAKMDPTALVREDVISDRRVGTIRMLTPITVEGVRDETRDVLFFGEAQIMTQVGALPINFQIEAKPSPRLLRVTVKRPKRDLPKRSRSCAKCVAKPPIRSSHRVCLVSRRLRLRGAAAS